MVPALFHAYELKRRNKSLRFESDSKQYEEKEKHRRAVDATKSSKFGNVKQRVLQKKSPSYVVEQGCTPQRGPRVACMEKTSVRELLKLVQRICSGSERMSVMSPSPTTMTLCLVIL
ncbi:hypothetical protein VPH35_111842 [Triticum aestivum]